ncbi:MAG: glycosyltransferase family 1 protein [Desulfobacterales bacterium]|nr:glycosyltransferase family 1 protein [Desulfobacterales bacterium]
MKVVLSVTAIRYPLTGIGRYTYELAKELAACQQIEHLLFAGSARLSEALPAPGADSDWMGRLRGSLLKQRWAVSAYRATVVPWRNRLLRGLEDHVFHGPNYYLPRFHGISVATFHDLSPYFRPEWHPVERVRYMRPEIDLSLQRAAMLITDSEFVRREVMARFGWPGKRVVAVPLASAKDFHPRPANRLAPVLARYDLEPGGYLLYAGTIEPRKNIGSLLDAYGRLPSSLRRRWPLVLAGFRGWKSDALHQRMNRRMREGQLRYLNFVSGEELPFLFAGARLFVFPSLYEGFGLPVLEAMASGVPVVCADAASLPEVAGDAAAMCTPRDVDALSRLMEMGLTDEAWRAAAIVKGQAQARRFSWRRCAMETLAVYQAAVNLQ